MSCVCGKCGRTDKCPADVTEDVSGCLQMIATRRKRRRGEDSCLAPLVCSRRDAEDLFRKFCAPSHDPTSNKKPPDCVGKQAAVELVTSHS